MARMPDLKVFAKIHNIPIVTIADLISYRLQNESFIKQLAQSKLPSDFSKDFEIKVFESALDHFHHVAVIKGPIDPALPTLVRVHSECFTGDVLGSLRCDCREQLHAALHMIAKSDQGVLLYLRQEGRGIGFANKIKAYAYQDEGLDTVAANEKLGFKADLREYGVGAQILKSLGISKMKLLTNNPRKIVGLEGYGLEVIERIPLEIQANETNVRYLETKKLKLGHLF